MTTMAEYMELPEGEKAKAYARLEEQLRHVRSKLETAQYQAKTKKDRPTYSVEALVSSSLNRVAEYLAAILEMMESGEIDEDLLIDDGWTLKEETEDLRDELTKHSDADWLTDPAKRDQLLQEGNTDEPSEQAEQSPDQGKEDGRGAAEAQRGAGGAGGDKGQAGDPVDGNQQPVGKGERGAKGAARTVRVIRRKRQAP